MLSSHICLRRILGATVVTFALCATTVGCGAASKSSSGKLCHLLSAGELSAADINASCVQAKTSHTSDKTIYSAHWGANAEAHNFLLVSVAKYTGRAASFELESLRRSMFAYGRRPFKVKGTGSVFAETFSGLASDNSATHHHFVTLKHGEAHFIVGNYYGTIELKDDNPSASDEHLERALIPIAETVAATL